MAGDFADVKGTVFHYYVQLTWASVNGCGRFVCGLAAIQMGRPSKICGSDAGLASPHHQQQQQQQAVPRLVHSPSPSSLAAAGGFLGPVAATLPHAAGSWRPELGVLHADWAAERRSSEPWSSAGAAGEYSADSGTGGLLTDDGASMEPSPKRRHSDSYASSSSPYQFSPSASSLDLAGDGQRSRQSSMSSQEAAAAGYPRGGPGDPRGVAGLWCPSPGALRMSGGDMIQQARRPGPSPHDHYMHWNMPPTTAVKLEGSVPGGLGLESFQAREMSDVIENIIRQQQQQHPVITHSSSTDFSLLHRHQQQQGKARAETT